jgi:hypothetical protein
MQLQRLLHQLLLQLPVLFNGLFQLYSDRFQLSPEQLKLKS